MTGLPRRLPRPSARSLAIGVPYGFLLLFFALPFAAVLAISLSEVQMSVPPYAPIARIEDGALHVVLHVAPFLEVLTSTLYIGAYLHSIAVAAATTLACLLVGYPACLLIARARPDRRNLLMMAVLLPFWTSYLIRVYAWIGLLKNQGLVNRLLTWLQLIDEPLRLYHSNAGLMIGMVYNYLPYLMVPLYAHLVKMDRTPEQAAANLGARPWEVLFTITLPMSRRAIIASSLLVFIPAVGEYVIPEILGGSDSLMIGRVMWDDFFVNADWPTACAATAAMVVLLLLPMAWFQRIQSRELRAR